MNETTTSLTPLMQQYMTIKSKYREEIVFFQVGDFYELFFDDAKNAASLLGITLTKRGTINGEHIPLCGVPVHMIDHYVPKLIKAGHTVLVCNQTEVAQPGKLVKREIAQVITPATLLNEETSEHVYSLFIDIDEKYISAFWFEFGRQEVRYSESEHSIHGLIEFKSIFEKYKPREIITHQKILEQVYSIIPYKKNIKGIISDDSIDISDFLKKYGLSDIFKKVGFLFLSYIKKYFENLMYSNHFVMQKMDQSNHLFLDNATIRYLECVTNVYNDTKENTLYEVLDKTKTKMGSRLLKEWILNPLRDYDRILERQSMIAAFLNMDHILVEKIGDFFSLCGDLERFFHRFRLQTVKDKDFIFLFHFVKNYTLLKEFIDFSHNSFLQRMFAFVISPILLSHIENTIMVDSDIIIDSVTRCINPSVDNELGALYNIIINQEKVLNEFSEGERKKTGITDLSIKKTPLYNYVFELSKIKDKKYEIPGEYRRVQTLTNKERYVSPALQELSLQVLHAEENYLSREKALKDELIQEIHKELHSIFQFIESIKKIDVYRALAICAHEYKWTRPTILAEGSYLSIIEGKHPVISAYSHTFIANSLSLCDSKKGAMITGPNMGGKSTYMKQNALLLLLSHIGSWIPAKSANIPLLEKILTRVGASDSLIEGKSTFFLELEELNTILHSATSSSFVIIDEIGRGTSTYDGIALAASIISYLLKNKKPYMLCSTHYHELKDILIFSELVWLHMDAVVSSTGITFLYRISEGYAAASMGISLAKQIGFPKEIIQDAMIYFDAYKKNNTKEEKGEIDICSIKSHKKIEIVEKILNNKSLDDISAREAYILLEKIYKEIL